jgi:hypothetical protein
MLEAIWKLTIVSVELLLQSHCDEKENIVTYNLKQLKEDLERK